MQEQDFKYVIQDVNRIYIGARFTYQELMEHDDVAFKLKAAIGNCILRDLEGEPTIGEHLLVIEEKGMGNLLYKQLSIKIKASLQKGEGENVSYESQDYSYQEFLKCRDELKDAFISEISFSKLRLMSLSL